MRFFSADTIRPGPMSHDAKKRNTWWTSVLEALIATAIFRCWHILLFYGVWATAISVISHHVYSLAIPSTLLIVLGTVLGFVISYRTTSSFERYNEGRRLWSQIILGNRNFARTVWFHVPEVLGEGESTPEENRARVLVEKVTVINLLLAFATSTKHYLRGEDGIDYEDLYHLVKFLPAYALPAGIPSNRRANSANLNNSDGDSSHRNNGASDDCIPNTSQRPLNKSRLSGNVINLPMPITTPKLSARDSSLLPTLQSLPFTRKCKVQQVDPKDEKSGREGPKLRAAEDPPQWALLDVFPLSPFFTTRRQRGRNVKDMLQNFTHNIPLEISFYLSSYVAELQKRKAIDPPTGTNLLNTLNVLVDALTGLERVLTTPIPFSYSAHLWAVTSIYCLILPFQIWSTLKWLTIPGTVILSFVFFGFLVLGEELENPFGYDKNDLDIDHITHNIIRKELRAITSTPPPSVAVWAFAPNNDALLYSHSRAEDREEPGSRATPEQWIQRGAHTMESSLSSILKALPDVYHAQNDV